MAHSHEHTSSVERGDTSFIKSPVGIAVAMLGLIAAFYFLREHWQHVAGNWPYLLLLACPVMHLFMHHGHGHDAHQHHGSGGQGGAEPNKEGKP
ncbi:DUF2933 domain-containing protein [Aquabacterium sp.]|uniref:DUF2933 domain-containing protein n=1 Tax=Aquabacterium sp. TaxID=1872578 RepID=UPI00198F01ED|nr:DUF2933 domain-containing protein [Aquabacterium sp.]MBC7702198.1 DUF2933 domain-containing protein [Aquabacterium sp.]